MEHRDYRSQQEEEMAQEYYRKHGSYPVYGQRKGLLDMTDDLKRLIEQPLALQEVLIKFN